MSISLSCLSRSLPKPENRQPSIISNPTLQFEELLGHPGSADVAPWEKSVNSLSPNS